MLKFIRAKISVMTESEECDAELASTERDRVRFVNTTGVLGTLLHLATGEILLFVAGSYSH